jgi:hypothetical protein
LFNNPLHRRLEHKPASGSQSVKLAYYNILSHVASDLEIEEKNKRDVKDYSEDLYKQYKDKSREVG